MEQFLLQFFIFLLAAVVAVPLAKRFKLGSVLGYLIAGIAIGPFGFSMISDVESIMHFTEFGVVMMLFLVGLELRPSMLWQMRTPILGMGGSQVLLTMLLLTVVMLVMAPFKQALAIGMILALSSTAIALQTLREKGLMNTPPGQSAFSVLLFQDLAVIPMLALLPLLATAGLGHGDNHGAHGNGGHGAALFDIASLPGYLQGLAILGAIAAVIVLGKYVSRPLFRTIAATRMREVFVAAALGLVIGISLLMTLVGLSPALGTFLAGVVLADSEYRHELESDIEPFKGLLLGIFFISIGASLDFGLIGSNVFTIILLVGALIAIKFGALLGVAKIFRMPNSERWLFAVALAQGGEFAFVLFQVAKTNSVLPADLTSLLVSVVAISMFLTPFMFILYDKVIAPKLVAGEAEREADAIEAHGSKVLLVGFGRLGTDLGRLLISSGVRPTILDHDERNVDLLRRFGFEVYYGDATRLDLLEAAGAAEAKVMIIALEEHEKALELIHLAKKHYPHLKIAANAQDRGAAYDFMDEGVHAIRREAFGSALRLGQDALVLLGHDPYEAFKRMRLFRKHDEEAMAALYQAHREREEDYVTMFREQEATLSSLIERDVALHEKEEVDRAWSTGNPEG